MYRDYITQEDFEAAAKEALPYVASVLNKLGRSEAVPEDLVIYAMDLSIDMTCSIITNALALLNGEKKDELIENVMKEICSRLLQRCKSITNTVEEIQKRILNDDFSDIHSDDVRVTIHTMDH